MTEITIVIPTWVWLMVGVYLLTMACLTGWIAYLRYQVWRFSREDKAIF